jgi:hypothetical protein
LHDQHGRSLARLSIYSRMADGELYAALRNNYQTLRTALEAAEAEKERLEKELFESQNDRQREHDLRVRLAGELEAAERREAEAREDAGRFQWAVMEGSFDGLILDHTGLRDLDSLDSLDLLKFARETVDAARKPEGKTE